MPQTVSCNDFSVTRKTIVGYFGRICSKGSFERFFDGAFLRRCSSLLFGWFEGKAEIDATETKGGRHDLRQRAYKAAIVLVSISKAFSWL